MPNSKPSTSTHKIPPSSDITAEYNDIGGGVNPLGYKGHRFTPNGGYRYSSYSSDPPVPPSSFKFSSRRANLPVYDFGEEEEGPPSFSIKRPPSISIPLSFPPMESHETQDNADLCCPLLGPISPFLGVSSLKQVGSSSFLPHHVYVIWRVLLLLLSLATTTVTAVLRPRSLAFLSAPLLFSVAIHVLLLRRAISYHNQLSDEQAISEKKYQYGWDAFVFQSAIHLCFMVPVTYFAMHYFVPSYYTDFDYVGTPSSYMLLFVTSLHMADIAITPILFRLTFVLPIAAYSTILCLIALWRARLEFSAWMFFIIGAGGLLSGVMLTVFGRAVYFLFHRPYLVAKDVKPLSPNNSPTKQVVSRLSPSAFSTRSSAASP